MLLSQLTVHTATKAQSQARLADSRVAKDARVNTKAAAGGVSAEQAQAALAFYHQRSRCRSIFPLPLSHIRVQAPYPILLKAGGGCSTSLLRSLQSEKTKDDVDFVAEVCGSSLYV